MSTHRHRLTLCPHCGHELDCCENTRDGRPSTPKAGDLTVCGKCAGVLKFDDDGLPTQTVSAEEFAALPAGVKLHINRLQSVIGFLRASI
jgi:hypothetical protein